MTAQQLSVLENRLQAAQTRKEYFAAKRELAIATSQFINR